MCIRPEKQLKGLGRTLIRPQRQKQKRLLRLCLQESPPLQPSPGAGKTPSKATDKPEKANQYYNIMNLPGSKNNNAKASTVAAYAKSQYGFDLTEVSFLLSPPNKNNKTIIISSSKPLY